MNCADLRIWTTPPHSPLAWASLLSWTRAAIWCGLWLAPTLRFPAQGTFVNLDFESPNVAGLTNSFVAFSDAFPGWTGHIGTSTDPSLQAGYNFIPGGSALTVLISTSAGGPTAANVIGGNYSAIIAAGLSGPTGALASASLSQIGTIPPAARSIRFSAAANANDLAVTFNSVNVPFLAVGSGSNYQVYAGDLTPFAGLTGELRFTELAFPTEPAMVIDDIVISSQAIPEPTTAGLIVLGSALLAWRLVPGRRRVTEGWRVGPSAWSDRRNVSLRAKPARELRVRIGHF